MTVERAPHEHFTLYFYAAVLRVLEQAATHFGSAEAATGRLPFLAGYFDELAGRGLEGVGFGEAHGRWRATIDAWERTAPGRLPLAALRRAAGLGHDDLTLLAQVGLPDEDPRFGLAFDALQGGGGERRATLAMLAAGWRRDASANGSGGDARGAAHRLRALGLVESASGDGGALRPSAAVWEAVRGSATVDAGGWARHRARDTLPELAALARALGKGVLDVAPLSDPGDPRWRAAATLACLLDAAIVMAAEPGPSETFALPALPGGLAPVFVTLGAAGGLSGPLADRAVTLRLPVPDRPARERLWRGALGDDAPALAWLRLTSGNIVRAAAIAGAGGGAADADSLRAAVRALERPGLEALARRVEAADEIAGDDWARLAVPAETLDELRTLAARCRQRERLGAFVGEALGGLGPGVRALFRGPSGTGKR